MTNKWEFGVWLKRNKSALKTLTAGIATITTDLMVAWNPTTASGLALKAFAALVVATGFRLLLDYIDFKLPDVVQAKEEITTL